jgi:hypothetical protein
MEKHSSLFIRSENGFIILDGFVLVGIGLVGSANKKFGDWTCLSAKFIKTFFLSHFLSFFSLSVPATVTNTLAYCGGELSFIVQAQLKPIVSNILWT